MSNLDNANCTALTISAPVEMLKPEGEQSSGFLIEAFTGAVVERWWGRLAIDVDGISARQNIPILLNHDPDQIVGFSQNTRSDNSFWVEGKFSNATDEARKARALADEGFPWQASIGVRAKKVLSIEIGESMAVNGLDVQGPADVWTETEVFETSFVPMGADGDTNIHTFSKFNERQAPNGAETTTHKEENFMDFTIDRLQDEAPELLKQIRADAAAEAKNAVLEEGAKLERERIQSVLAQSMAGHDDLVQALAFDGKTTGPEAAVQVLAAEKSARKTAQQNFADDAIEPVAPSAASTAETVDGAAEVTAENFSQHRDIVAEFGEYGVYAAYEAAMDNGLARIVGGKK